MMLALALAAQFALGPAQTDAAPGLALSWEVEPGCSSRDEFVEHLSRFLPTLGLVETQGPRPSVRVRIHALDATLWQVELELSSGDQSERRVFEAERCQLAVEAAALVTSVALDPVLVAAQIRAEAPVSPDEGPTEPRPRARPEAGGETARARSEPPSETPAREVEELEPIAILTAVEVGAPAAPRAQAKVRAGLALVGGGGYGPLRTGSAQLGLQLAALGPSWRVELAGAWLPPLQLTLPGQLRARFDGWTLGARACWVPARASLEFPLCGGLEAGQLRGEGLEPIPTTTRATQPWAGADLGVGLWWAPIERLALGLAVEGVVALTQGGFSVDGVEVQGYAPVGVRGLARVELRLPSSANSNHGSRGSR